MSSLPKTPFTDIDITRVAVDAPVSTDLMTDLGVNENYLKSVLTDGAAAIADINGNNAEFHGTVQVDGSMSVLGSLSVGVFFSSEQLLFLMGV